MNKKLIASLLLAASLFLLLVCLAESTATATATSGETEQATEQDDTRMEQPKSRSLTLKALILGPLIGITLGKAMLRGLLWAIAAYALHLFFPGLLGVLGLGTGLVGFARQMRPDYAQFIVHTLINLHDEYHRLPPQANLIQHNHY